MMPPSPQPASGPVPIIFDTDMCGDCDDAGALAILHRFADAGEAAILACIVNSRDGNGAAGAAVNVINTYYGRPDLPLGKYHGSRSKLITSYYTAALRDEFPHSAPIDDDLPAATALYRRTLAAAQDGRVVIVSIGFLTALHELLASGPDEESPLSGVELARLKVRELVIMGGRFPASRPHGPEFNFENGEDDGRDAQAVVDGWPTPILFTGYEIGLAIRTGLPLAGTGPSNPVRRAYELYPCNGGYALTVGRPSWDHTAVLAAVRDPALYWGIVAGGRCVITEDGSNTWEPDAASAQRYLAVKTPPEELARLIDGIMVEAPVGL